MNVRTERQTERQTDRPHQFHIYVGLAQARPNYVGIILDTFSCLLCKTAGTHIIKHFS